ncbi:oligosaccharide flippase family protein [uncultured Muribaculum sp.]|uniref:oligosaccharide flippase family protein n=1 Tax=uncultured Muribaculum sp. TaxID=1918613 RepID=UPI002591B4A2|nr:oligosaccharide flippase family protein [uncultured Muribaculum sp.]
MANIKKNFLYSCFLTTANYIFPLLTFPYVSRILGATNFGLCNFIDGIIDYFVLFSMMGIGLLGIREIAFNKDNGKLSNTFFNLLILTGITTIVALIALVLAALFVPRLNEHIDLMSIGGCKLLFNFLLIEWFYKGIEDFKYITIRSIIVRSLYVACVFIFVKESTDYAIYYLLTVSMIVLNACVNIIHVKKYVKWNDFKFNVSIFIKPFFTLGIYLLLTSMYTTFNVAFLGFVGNDTQVGYYTTATKLYNILLAIYAAFTGVMMPRMSALVSEGKIQEFKGHIGKSMEFLFSVSIPLIIYVIILAPQIIRLIAGDGYIGAVMPMQIVMPLILIIGYEQILVVQTLMPLRADKIVLVNSAIGAVFGLVLNLLIVPVLFSVGSAMVWVMCEVLILFLSQIAVTKNSGIKFPVNLFFKNIICFVPLSLLFLGVNHVVSNFVLQIVINGCLMVIYAAVIHILFFKDGICYEFVSNTLRKIWIQK